MANEQNLMPIQEVNSRRTPEQHSADSRKAGIASGKARKRKATFKNAIKWLAESDIKIKEGDMYNHFKKSGIDISNLDPTQLATIGLWYGAVQGNASNYKTLMEGNNEVETERDTPVLKIEVVDNSELEGKMYDEENWLW